MWRKKHITTFPLERDPQGEFPMGCCKVSTMTMTQKGAVQTTYCFWYWCLVLDFLFMILRKNQETNMWRSKFTTWHKSFEKMGGRFVHNFPWDAVKVSTIPLWFKRMLFKQHGVLIMVFGDYFSFMVFGNRTRNKTAKISIYQMSQVILMIMFWLADLFLFYNLPRHKRRWFVVMLQPIS